jgi:methionyl-tRNA formyltransferase
VGAGGEGERGAGPVGGSGVGRLVGNPRLGVAEGTVLVVCAFGALIREPLLSAYTPLNVHPSLLPRWRGAAPVERAIMAGDERTGVSIMRLTAGLDSGPVCSAGSEPIAPGDTYGTLAPRLAQLGGGLLADVLDAFACGAPPPFVEQDEALATYAEKIASADRLLDPQCPAVELERVVRALYPHIGARLAIGPGEPLGVRRAHVWDDAGAPPAGELTTRDGRLLYGTRDGALELLEVQPPGGRPMDAAAYLRGHGPPRA